MRALLYISALMAGGFALSACGEPEPVDPPPGMQGEMQQPTQQQDPTPGMAPESEPQPGQDMPATEDDPMNHPYGSEDDAQGEAGQSGQY